ncbi:MAG: hypothetical protein VX501_03295 [Pseudomonadota bacterium]|nr:hypothetical protein [Pseudomonadota bacterium]
MKLLFRGFLVLVLVWLVGAYFVPKRMQDGPLGYAMALHPANILSHSAIDCAYRQGELDGIMYLFKGGSARLERANDCMRIARFMPSPMYRTQRRLDWEWLNYLTFSGKGAQAAEGWVNIARSDAFTFSQGMEGDGAAAWRRAVWAAGSSEDNIRVIELAREALSILASDAYAERFVAAVEGLD